MSGYSIKELFYTLQGEGYHTGRPAVFLRFAGCNLWSGREEDRATAVCTFCDTDFRGTDGVNGGRYTGEEIAIKIRSLWPTSGPGFVVCTGGEPLLQLDTPLIQAMHDHDLEIAIETNGTLVAPDNIDWICVSPKAHAKINQKSGDELKLVFPQPLAMPSQFEKMDFTHFYLQPMDGPDADKNVRLALDYCLEHPRWKLSLQTHKILQIP